jgi:hypothetical protein
MSQNRFQFIPSNWFIINIVYTIHIPPTRSKISKSLRDSANYLIFSEIMISKTVVDDTSQTYL